MNKNKALHQNIPNQDIRTTKDGIEYDYNLDVWVIETPYDSKKHFNFKLIKQKATHEFYVQIKNFTAILLTKLKTSSIYDFLRHFNQFISTCNSIELIQSIKLHELINFISKNCYTKCISAKAFIVSISDLGFKYVDADALQYLKKLKFKREGLDKFVLTANPIQGPLTSSELSALLNALDQKFEESEIDLRHLVLSYLFFALGLRPKQVAMLKVKDFYCVKNENGVDQYYLNVPRLKQTGYDDRELFRERKLHKSLSSEIRNYVEELEGIYSEKEINIPFLELALFPNSKREKFNYHATSQRMNVEFEEVWNNTNIISDRTKNKINMNPYRARRTIGTRAGIEGHNERYIANILDHSTVASVKCYVKLVQEMTSQIQDAISDDIAPLISAFQGEVISNIKIPGTKHRIRNHAGRSDSGICANKSGCGIYSTNGEPLTIIARVPFSCYTCRHFSAWSNIDIHREHLTILLNMREHVLKGGSDTIRTEYYNMASSLDLTISAVEDVIRIIHDGKFMSKELELESESL